MSHNHLWFYRRVMEAASAARDWDAVERYAAALEAYTRSEPLPWAQFFVARGRVLAAHGRDRRAATIHAEMARLREEADQAGLKSVLLSLDVAPGPCKGA